MAELSLILIRAELGPKKLVHIATNVLWGHYLQQTLWHRDSMLALHMDTHRLAFVSMTIGK